MYGAVPTAFDHATSVEAIGERGSAHYAPAAGTVRDPCILLHHLHPASFAAELIAPRAAAM